MRVGQISVSDGAGREWLDGVEEGRDGGYFSVLEPTTGKLQIINLRSRDNS